MIAKFDGQCRICSNPVLTGNDIEYNKELPKGQQVAHTSCLPKPEPKEDLDEPQFFSDWESLDKPIEWLVDGLVQIGGAMLFAAESKAGKSTTTGDLVRALLQGGEFAGRQVKKSKVLYCVFDEPVETLAERFKNLGIDIREESRAGRLNIITSPPGKGRYEEFVRRAWEKSNADVLVTDTLFDLLGLEGESVMNAYSVIKPALTNLRGLAKGKSQIWITHANKGDGRSGMSIRNVIGSGAFAASADTILMLESDPKSNDRFLSAKGRRGVYLARTLMEFDERTGRVSLGQSKHRRDVDRAKDAILVACSADGGTRDELAVLSGYRIEIGRNAVDLLLQDGWIEAIGTGKKGDPRRFKITNDARHFTPTANEILKQEAFEIELEAMKN